MREDLQNHGRNVGGEQGLDGFYLQPKVTSAKSRKAAINKITVFHTGRNDPKSKAVDFRPIDLDHSGTTYTFHPLGTRFVKRERKVKITGPIGLDGQPTEKMAISLEWVADPKLPPVEEGQNTVEVPVGAWMKWMGSAGERKRFSHDIIDKRDPTKRTRILLLSSSNELAQKYMAAGHEMERRIAAMGEQERQLAGRVAALQEQERQLFARLAELEISSQAADVDAEDDGDVPSASPPV